MDERWKGLFPRSGVRADDNNISSSSDNVSLEDSDSDAIIRAEDTVDISKDDDDDDDDDDDFDALGSQGDSHDAAARLRIGVDGSPKKIRETAPAPPDDQRERRTGSSNRPAAGTSSSTSSKARREEAEATARRWRRGMIKSNEPASSCSSRVGQRGEWTCRSSSRVGHAGSVLDPLV